MSRTIIQVLNIIWLFIKYALLLSVIIFIIVIILLATAYRDFKAVAQNGLQGKQEITTAVDYVKAQNWTAASEAAVKAQNNFSASLLSLDKIRVNPAVKSVGLVKIQINDLEYLLKTGEILSRSLERSTSLIQEVEKIRSGGVSKNFVDLSTSDKQRLLQLLYESEPELNGLKANLDLAIFNLDKIHKIGVLWPVYSQISNIKLELNQASALMAKIVPLTELLPALAGYPENSRYLIILQNNDELRPTGGFIGVYAILETKDGEVLSLKTDDSYHLDMPASLSDKWIKEPPAPIKKYLKVQKWYFRDANWSPDWPTSARQIQEIFQGELQTTDQASPPFTGIVAVNPELVADLIKLVGPITIRGETYTSDNLQPLLQYNVEVAYKEQDISSWNRKDIINELMAELKKRLFNLPAQQWNDLLNIIDTNVTERNIQIFFNNNNWENLAQNLKASGEVAATNNDYLMVVDSNFGAFKSDVVVKKDLGYTLTQTNNQLKASVKLNYTHEGGFDWRTTRYRSYTRVYVPLGSKFESLTGLDEATQDLSIVNDEQLGKTIFGFFLTVEPGSAQNIIVNYSLPDSLSQSLQSGQYSLLVQKQSGNRINSLGLNFQFSQAISRASLPNVLINRSQVSLLSDLNIDQPLTIYFK